MKVQVEIEIPDSVLSEYEATGEHRPPRAGENYWNDASKEVGIGPAVCTTWNFAILRKKWQWPANFEGVAAMARDAAGNIWAFANAPRVDGSTWIHGEGRCYVGEWMHPNLNFPRPDRWQDSLRINPNFKQ